MVKSILLALIWVSQCSISGALNGYTSYSHHRDGKSAEARTLESYLNSNSMRSQGIRCWLIQDEPSSTSGGTLEPAAFPIAVRRAFAFKRISSYSSQGSDCTTMAPPAPIFILSPLRIAVRMTMLRSNAPLKDIYPSEPE